jgi:leucyl-tRNA synthetase
VIEIDGKIHEQQTEYDAQRTAILNGLGYSVIRFKNEEVFENIDKVLKSISDAISARLV